MLLLRMFEPTPSHREHQKGWGQQRDGKLGSAKHAPTITAQRIKPPVGDQNWPTHFDAIRSQHPALRWGYPALTRFLVPLGRGGC